VPDTTNVKIDPKTGTLIREGVPSIVNPEDKNALEMALNIKEEVGEGTITVITMGPPQADAALRECLAMGADKVVLLSDRAFAGGDTWATSYTLANAITNKIGAYDLVICGRQAIDGDTAQVGPQTAEQLGVAQITYVVEVKLDKKAKKITAKRQLEDGYEMIEAPLPCLITVCKEANEPRYPTLPGIMKAYQEQKVETWSTVEIGGDKDNYGLKGSPTQVKKTFTPHHKRAGEIITETPDAAAKILVSKLREKNIV